MAQLLASALCWKHVDFRFRNIAVLNFSERKEVQSHRKTKAAREADICRLQQREKILAKILWFMPGWTVLPPSAHQNAVSTVRL